MPQLVEPKEIPLETLSLETLAERIILAWDYMKAKMSETFLDSIFIKSVTSKI
jgi:hypothetical protein